VTSTDTSEMLVAAFVGARPTPAVHAEPFTTLDHLMYVIEALCPVWPSRPLGATGGRYTL
jgi:hypothetical protein